MLDIKLVRENPKQVRLNLQKRQDNDILDNFDSLVNADEKYRKALQRMEDLKAKRNKATKEIADLKREKKNADKKIQEMQRLGDQIKVAEKERGHYLEQVTPLLMKIPNLLHDSVPVGKDDTENKEVRKSGSVKFPKNPKDHLTILENLDLIDTESAARVSGHGFFYLKKELALLDLALQRFAVDYMTKKGYALINPPYMLQRKPYEGVTDLEDFENVMYKVEGEDLYLIATAEHPLAAMHMNQTLNLKDLPIKLIGISPCFRREVGTHGKYTKGLFRMHQFHKIEMFVFSHPNQSWKIHEEMQKLAEDIYKQLGIAYRVVNVCTGDIGSLAAKKYDIEFLMADGQYREIGSNSNCTDYQARRLGIRFRESEGKKPSGFVHTINNTVLATSRAMVAIVEQNQKPNGSVAIPKVLQPYMNGIKELKCEVK